MSLYSKRGVSAHKEEVLAATATLSKGLYPHAFCKVYPDYLGSDPDYVSVMHADGAGTKSILAYLYWKQTGDLSVWKGIAQDAIVMNLDDLLCVGIYDRIVFNSTIDRNKLLIPGEVLDAIIKGTQAFFDEMKTHDIHIHYLGGETADVGDVVRTVAVNGTMTARWPSNRIITNEKISDGDVIVGLASFGRSVYETAYNSGIGSNGLTSARHDILSSYYAEHFPESYDTALPPEVVYRGNSMLTDSDPSTDQKFEDIGKMILSPTRTFAPLIKSLLTSHFDEIHGMIHCSGGGQTKCLKYLPQDFRIIKDHLFEPPQVFKLIQQNSGATDREMYEVFNMGCRMEIYCRPEFASVVIDLANQYGIEAREIGRVEKDVKKSLIIQLPGDSIVY
jgi:phosphoribosylformylglycinamidine cyclo-ligase